MPLARIITRSPHDTVAVSEYLLSLGYAVETISPGEFRVTPAELELNLDQCHPGEVMQRAQALLEAQVASAAAGAPAALPEPDPPQRPKIAVAYDIAGRPVEFSEEETPERGSRSGSFGGALVSMLRRAARSIGGSAVQSCTSVGARIRHFRQRRAEERGLAVEAELAHEREEMLQEEERARERVRQEIERQRIEAEQAELRRQRRITAEKEEEERHRVAAERAAAEAREARVRPRGRHLRVRISRVELATAAAAALIVALGVFGYSVRRAASPLSPGELMRDGSIKQQVPFGAATITPAAVAPKPSPAAVAPTAKPSPSARSTSKPTAARGTGRRLRRAAEDDPVAEDDVVVRHLQTQGPKQQSTTSASKLKQYSDVN